MTFKQAVAVVEGLSAENIGPFVCTRLSTRERLEFEHLAENVSLDVLVLVAARALAHHRDLS